MPVSFGTPDKFNAAKGYRHVLFGKDGYLAEWELNELQKIQRSSLASLAQALTGREDGVFSGTITFNGSTVTATNLVALIKGELVTFTGTLAATTGDSLYLALTETTVTKATDTDLQYPEFNGEESTRRIKYDVALSKTNADSSKRYLLLGSIAGGSLVLTYNSLVPTADIGSDDINVVAFKSASTSLASYPAGVTMFQYTTGDAGYPLTNAVVMTTNPPDVSTGFQSITGLQNGRVHQRFRQWNGTAWTAWTRDDEIELLRARTISAGTGLSGGGDLTANRSFSVNFAGTGTANTSARSDHNHDTTYAPLTRSIATGAGLTGGGDLNANRTLAVDFAGSGAANTVARSDHSHAFTNLTDVSLTNPSSGQTVRHNGTSWVNSFLAASDLSDVTLTTPASGHVLQHDGTKFVNRTIAAAGIAATTTSVSAGAGLTGGGDLSASRSLAVSFAGTGAANTVARSDHNHDTSYAPLARTLVAGAGLTGGGDLTANRTLSVVFGGNGAASSVARSDHHHDTDYVLKGGDTMTSTLNVPSIYMDSLNAGIEIGKSGASNTPFIDFRSSSSVTDYDSRIIASGGNNLNGKGSMQFITSAVDILGTLSTAGAITEAGTALSSKYAAIGTSISAGTGLTGGGTLAATRTLSVSFGGNGAATTVARSDHNHDASYASLSSDNVLTGLNTITGANNLHLKGGTADRVYISFFARSASQSTRSAYMGYGAAGNNDFTLNNELSGGNITLSPGTGGVITLAGTGGVVSTGAITEQGTALASKYAPIGTTFSAGAGLTGGGSLAANRTFAVSFGGTGSASTVARSDHNHDSTYVNLSGSTQTVASSLVLNGTTTIVGTLSSPVGDARNDGTLPLSSYPVGLSWQGTTTATGQPSSTGSVLSFYESTSRNFQLFHFKNTHNLYLRTWHDANAAWLPYKRIALDDDVAYIDNKYSDRTISAGAGLTGGGSLAANRSLAVSFGGTGSASTVARSDHNHDSTYVNKTGDSMSGALTIASTSAIPFVLSRTNATTNVSTEYRTTDNSIFAGHGTSGYFAVGTAADLTSTYKFRVQMSTGNTDILGTLSTSGAITEQGTSLASKYASVSRTISAGAGLTGGGSLAANRSLAVAFDGSGTANTAARSDHTHNYVSQYGDYMYGQLYVQVNGDAIRLEGSSTYASFYRSGVRYGFVGIPSTTTNALRIASEQGWLDIVGEDGVAIYVKDNDGDSTLVFRADGAKESAGVWVELGGGSRTHIIAGEKTISPESDLNFTAGSESMILESNSNLYLSWDSQLGVSTSSTVLCTSNYMRPYVNDATYLGSPSYRWKTIYAINALSTSDSAFKDNITLLNAKEAGEELNYTFTDISELPREDAVANPDEILEYILEMPLYAFDYKDAESGGSQYGFMADQLLQNDPTNVAKRFVYASDGGATVSTQSYVAALHIAFQRHVEKDAEEKQALQSRIDTLTEELDVIKKHLNIA